MQVCLSRSAALGVGSRRLVAPASAVATMVAPSKLEGPADTTAVLQRLSEAYDKVHVEFENNFWSTKMNLKGNSPEESARTKDELDNFLGDPANLAAVREQLKRTDVSAEQRKVLQIMERTFLCYITEDPSAKAIKEKLNKLEAELAAYRNTMKLGYTEAGASEPRPASSVQLRNTMRVSEHEAVRKSCYEGLRSIGPFVVEKYIEIVKLRNKLARLLGFEDFFDYKVSGSEGFSKARCFEMLDDLETKTRPIMEAARKALAQEKGQAALEPWNMSQALSGDVTKAADPYFPFEDAVDVWGRTFAALGIKYEGSVMSLDLLDREGKYSNGFCHWPQCAWRRPDGTWVPAQANFTSLATPNEVGSGKTALETLLHEGGHAAHFANIQQYSPFFSQERAPTSVSYAENQSMFLDSLAGDAAWLGRYALSRQGEVIPWDIVKAMKEASHPYEVFQVRAMLAVPYLEKALYEAKEEDLTPEFVQNLADDVEKKIQGGLSPRPLLSVPHILADESSCYYQGYVFAEMSVHQTRKHFFNTYGSIVDNPKIGEDLASIYWRPGNAAMFLDLVQQLTGQPLRADAWVDQLQRPLPQLLGEEHTAYEEAIKTGPRYKQGDEIDIGMRIRLVHGDELISDSEEEGSFQKACAKFKAWVRARFFKD